MVKGNQPTLQRAIYDLIQAGCPRALDHVEIDYGHGRIIKRSLWVADADADGLDFPHVKRAVRIRRDGYDAAGTLISKEIVHAVTTLGAGRATPADLAGFARGQWGIESVHWVRSPGVLCMSHDVAPDARRRAFCTHLRGCGARCRCCSEALPSQTSHMCNTSCDGGE